MGNAQLAVQGDNLYIYGGTYEKGDREFTFDDMYAINLDKLDGCKQIFERPVEDWIDSDDEGGDDDEDEGEDDEDEDEDEDGDGEEYEDAEKPITPSKRKKKQDEMSEAGGLETSDQTAPTSSTEDDAASSTVDDGLPHPRPFESRRDFFVRTSNEWQEILMTSLRWKNVQPESMPIKEIKAKAYQLSEEKWWDCREEITALEEEQEAAGIQEVVSLAEKGDAGAGGGRRR